MWLGLFQKNRTLLPYGKTVNNCAPESEYSFTTNGLEWQMTSKTPLNKAEIQPLLQEITALIE